MIVDEPFAVCSVHKSAVIKEDEELFTDSMQLNGKQTMNRRSPFD
jgi:hypothetical protein